MADKIQTPCEQCPWRTSNQGKRHPNGFYTKANLRRLWNQIRGGGTAQSCHLTDPSHPDHIAAGASPNAKAKECPGSVILILREIRKMSTGMTISDQSMKKYLKIRRKGITARGVLYWVFSRYVHGKVPILGEGVLPEVDEHDQAIGLPPELAEG